MRWSVRHLLGLTTVVALVLCAFLMLDDNDGDRWRFVYALYFAQVVAVAVIGWHSRPNLKPSLMAYALSGGITGLCLIDTSTGTEMLRMAFVGILISCACALTVGLVTSKK
jgi:hypothetical protein